MRRRKRSARKSAPDVCDLGVYAYWNNLVAEALAEWSVAPERDRAEPGTLAEGGGFKRPRNEVKGPRWRR